VSYATLRRHYGRWMPTEDETELQRLEAIAPALFSAAPAKLSPTKSRRGDNFRKSRVVPASKECEEGDLNPEDATELLGIFQANVAPCCVDWPPGGQFDFRPQQ